MKIVIAGGTGFLGRPLVASLSGGGHDVTVLTRGTAAGRPGVIYWQPDGSIGDWARVIDDADAVINLAGESIADGRWTSHRKVVLRDSRILSTRSLVAAIRGAERKPAVLVSGSAIGYYGNSGDAPVDESFPPGSDFLARLCVDWEAEARAVTALGCRLVIVRTGVVLAREGGALKQLIPPFRWFVGGPIGSGGQFLSWIHRDDWTALVAWATVHPLVSDVVNATAPEPVTNTAFSKALGRALHRPSWIPVPRLPLKILLGEMADVALVSGQRVLPRRALELGFAFQHGEVNEAVQAAVR